MFDLYEGCGLVFELAKHMSELLKYHFSDKMREQPNYLEIYEETWDKTFHHANWLKYFHEYGITELTEEIKQNITEIFEKLSEPIESILEPSGYISGINEFLYWLLNLDVVLSHFLYYGNGLKESENPTFQQIKQYYDFLRNEVEKRQYLIPEPFNIQPIQRFMNKLESERARIRVQQRREQEIQSRECPHCGARGRQVIKKGSGRAFCKNCHKSFYI